MSSDNEAVQPSSGAPRLDYLDALRGVAAVAVAFFHLSIATPGASFGAVGDRIIAVLADEIDLGKLGVVVFFAVSGFIIPSSLYRGRGKEGGGASPARRFVIGRFFRLYPLYWVSLLACVLVLPVADWPGLGVALANLTMVQGFLLAPDINGASWTLEIEMVFYAMCMGLFLLGRLHSRPAQFLAFAATLLGALALAFARQQLHRKLPVALPLAMSVMFFGCLWRGVVLERDPRARPYAFWSLACLVLLIPVVCVTAYSENFGFNERPGPYVVCYFAGLATFVAVTSWPRAYPRLLVHLGTISYSIYLLHTPVILLARRLGWMPRADAAAATNWVILAGIMVAVVAVSHLSYLWVEKPGIAWGRRLVRRQPRLQVRQSAA